MAKYLSGDESPQPQERPVTFNDSGTGRKNELSAEREEDLFQLVQAGAAARERLTECISNGILQHIASCGDSPLATENLQVVVGDAISSVISQQSLHPTGHMEFCDSLCKSMRTQLEALLHDQTYGVECGSTDWLNQVCSETMIQPAIGDDLWEMEEEWESLSQRELAIQEMIESHLPLAKSIARTKQRSPSEREDLTHEAILIFRRLMDSFKLNRGVRFGSYAKTVLLRDLRRQYESKQGLTRYSSEQAKAVNKAERQLTQDYGRPVTADELYDLLGHSDETRIEIENVRRLLKAESSSSQADSTSLLSTKATSCPEQTTDEELDYRSRVILPAFRKLSDFEKRIVVGKVILGLSSRELAKRYRKNHATIKRLYESGLKLLAESITSPRLPQKPR